MNWSASSDQHAVDAGPYVLGALDPAERLDFERHLRSCADCSKTVADLAGLPALLSTVPVEVAESLLEPADAAPGTDPDVAPSASHAPPSDLFVRVMARAGLEQRERRRRHVLVLAAAAAVVLLASVVGVATTIGNRDDSAQPGDAQVLVMDGASDGPLAVTARLESVAWGTRIELECRYSGSTSAYATPPTYALVVLDDSGHGDTVATWRAVPGRDITVDGATAVPRDRITALEVQTADGRPVLTVDR